MAYDEADLPVPQDCELYEMQQQLDQTMSLAQTEYPYYQQAPYEVQDYRESHLRQVGRLLLRGIVETGKIQAGVIGAFRFHPPTKRR